MGLFQFAFARFPLCMYPWCMALTYRDTSFIFAETLGKAKVSEGMEDTYAP